MVVETNGNPVADSGHDLLFQDIRSDFRELGAGLDCTHPAADVHSDCIGNDDVLGGQDTADGHAHAAMQVRHESQVVEHERKGSKIHDLLPSVRVYTLRPNLDGRVVDR